MKAYIYKITNVITDDLYIGSTINFEKRKAYHIYELLNQTHHSNILQNSWNKHGKDNFIFSILHEIEADDLSDILKLEQHYLDQLSPRYNICKIAGSPLGIKHTDKARENMRNSHLGKKLSAESIEKRTKKQSGKNHWSFNKKRNTKDIEKISIGVKKFYEDGGKHHQLNKPRTNAEKDNISKSLMKKVNQYDLNGILIKSWDGAKIIEKELGIKRHNIQRCCSGKYNSYANFIWKYD